MKTKKSQFDKAVSRLSSQTLSDEVKSRMLDTIYAETPIATATPTPFVYGWSSWYRYAATSFVVIFLISTGTAYASLDSLPGDWLYGVKTEVLEPLALSLHFEAEGKNRYRLSLLQKRIEEVEELKEQGRATVAAVRINFDVTSDIVGQLENGAIFSEEGENEAISSEIRSYNSKIMDFDLQIDTIIKEVETVPAIMPTTNTDLDSVVNEKVEEIIDVDDVPKMGNVAEEVEVIKKVLPKTPLPIPEGSPVKSLSDEIVNKLDL